MKYIYPAIFEKDENNNFNVTFPDIEGAFTFGSNLTEAFTMAEDCLGCALYGMEEDNQKFPSASNITNYQNTDEKFVSLIQLDLEAYKKKNVKAVKKTVYIPKDLNDKAEELQINFSKVLREALKKELDNG